MAGELTNTNARGDAPVGNAVVKIYAAGMEIKQHINGMMHNMKSTSVDREKDTYRFPLSMECLVDRTPWAGRLIAYCPRSRPHLFPH